jgi:phosphoserine aminotransferase
VNRIYNFSAGPAAIPEAALKQAQQELLELPGCGASVMEISHRSKPFDQILTETDSCLRTLLNIPQNYHILFLQGGARLQFSMAPMNLARGTGKVMDFVVTGSWSDKARGEATREGEVHTVWDGKATNYDRLPANDELKFSRDAALVHITSNETIQGVQFPSEPEVGDVPLVCDASSDLLSRPIPVERYGIIYACAQKNVGPAGLTIVVIRDDLLERSQDSLPTYLNYSIHAKHKSTYNTPPTFAVYMAGLVAKWLRDDIGGLAAMHRQNQDKAQLLYDAIDRSDGFYKGHAQPECRSIMNVPFRLPTEDLEKQFLTTAEAHGLGGLKGHRSVGGIRASIYNAMPPAGVEKLRDFMLDFQKQRGS